MTEYLRNVLKTYQDNAPKTLQGPASLSLSHHHLMNSSHHYSNHQYHQMGGKRELDSPPPTTNVVSSEDDFKNQLNRSPSPQHMSMNGGSSIIERTDSRTISSPATPPLNGRDYCASPIAPPITFIQMPLQPIQSQPILTAPDPDRGLLQETVLEGRTIGCFQLGGELRLCFAQILTSILSDFTLDRINRTIEELHISISPCSPEQLTEFKLVKILPLDVRASGLLTRTNAERLCSALLHQSERPSMKMKKIKDTGSTSFRVYHRCFGKSEGICTPDLYNFGERACIECVECKGLYPPNKFVCHVCKNKPKENRTCHWGFESNRWRSYVHVSLDEPLREKYTKMLDDIHAREMDYERIAFEQERMDDASGNLKRKAGLEDGNILTPKQEPLDIPMKKSKIDDTLMNFYNQALFFQFSQQYRQPWMASPKNMMQQFGQGVPVMPYLTPSQEPPILQNPERVVRVSECERFERSFQPNVALAPRQNLLTKERDPEKDELMNHQSSVIKCDIQIKQERPSTPMSVCNESPELRNTSPETTDNTSTTMTMTMMTTTVATAPPPISPEGQSGSNEITSSTSPIPTLIPNKLESISPPPRPTSQTSPSRSHHMLNSHHHNHHHNHNNHKSSPKPQSMVNGVSGGNNNINNNLNNNLNNNNNKNGNAPIIGNPEFELSTDTDEESLGEPDSSNLNNNNHIQTPWDFATSLLQSNTKEDREKILNLIKYLVKENTQLKENSSMDKKLIDELQQKQDCLRKDVERLQLQVNQNRTTNINLSSVIASASCLSSSSSSSSSSSLSSNSSFDYSERRNSLVDKPVLIKPPKKSILRITPIMEDCKMISINNTATPALPPSIVMIPKREDIVNNNTKMSNNNNINGIIINGINGISNNINNNKPESSTDTTTFNNVQLPLGVKNEKL